MLAPNSFSSGFPSRTVTSRPLRDKEIAAERPPMAAPTIKIENRLDAGLMLAIVGSWINRSQGKAYRESRRAGILTAFTLILLLSVMAVLPFSASNDCPHSIKLHGYLADGYNVHGRPCKLVSIKREA